MLVTGGSGFIGLNIVEHYLAKGYKVLSLDIVEPKLKNHLDLWKKVDILSLDDLTNTIRSFSPTHVIHLAARTDLNEKKNMDGYAANTKGVENIIQALKNCPDLIRVMFVSSMYVCYPGYNPVNYEDYAPHTLYGTSKMLFEKIIKDNTSIHFEWTIIRPTSIWGPWFGHPYKDFFYHIRRGTYFKMTGKTATKTYGFIFNSIHQIDSLLFSSTELVNKRTFYIGDYPGLNINDWADEIAYQMKRKLFKAPRFVMFAGAWLGDILSLVGIPFPLQSFRISNMTTDNVIELLKETQNITGESPYTVKQGVKITLDWLKSHDPNFAN